MIGRFIDVDVGGWWGFTDCGGVRRISVAARTDREEEVVSERIMGVAFALVVLGFAGGLDRPRLRGSAGLRPMIFWRGVQVTARASGASAIDSR